MGFVWLTTSSSSALLKLSAPFVLAPSGIRRFLDGVTREMKVRRSAADFVLTAYRLYEIAGATNIWVVAATASAGDVATERCTEMRQALFRQLNPKACFLLTNITLGLKTFEHASADCLHTADQATTRRRALGSSSTSASNASGYTSEVRCRLSCGSRATGRREIYT